jgi:hypothetical protein
MALQINANTVITDGIAINNIAGFDATSAKAMSRAIVNNSTIEDGTTVRARRSDVVSKSASGSIQHSFFGIQQSGNVNLFFEALSTLSTVTSQATIVRYRNGASSTIFTQNLTNTSYSSFNTTQTVIAGDTFEFRIAGGTAGDTKIGFTNSTGRMANASVRTSASTVYMPANGNQYFWYTVEQT